MTAPARLSEREAIDTLRVIAALHGGQVNELGRGTKTRTANGWAFDIEKIGLVIYDPPELQPFDMVLRWVWTREDGALAWRTTRSLRVGVDGTVYAWLPLGRIDRGLGAIR